MDLIIWFGFLLRAIPKLLTNIELFWSQYLIYFKTHITLFPSILCFNFANNIHNCIWFIFLLNKIWTIFIFIYKFSCATNHSHRSINFHYFSPFSKFKRNETYVHVVYNIIWNFYTTSLIFYHFNSSLICKYCLFYINLSKILKYVHSASLWELGIIFFLDFHYWARGLVASKVLRQILKYMVQVGVGTPTYLGTYFFYIK